MKSDDTTSIKKYPTWIKRVFDVVAATMLLLLLSPVLLVLAITIWITMGAPVLFKQVRPGLHGRLFTMYKFRTMTDARDDEGNLLPNEQRVTRIGQFLRSTSLDELPELFNVLRGDMSLVGPRPLLMDYLSLYTPRQSRRHEVLPGITGWAQVNGRNAITWEEKFELDVWYVENHTFFLDLQILWRTFITVLKREGISHDGYVAMPRFTGRPSGTSDDRSAEGLNRPVGTQSVMENER